MRNQSRLAMGDKCWRSTAGVVWGRGVCQGGGSRASGLLRSGAFVSVLRRGEAFVVPLALWCAGLPERRELAACWADGAFTRGELGRGVWRALGRVAR